MDILKYILINLLLFSSWYSLLYRKRDSLRFSDRLTGSFILGLTQIIATEMLLGVVFEYLYPNPLFILNLLISSSVLLTAIRNAGTAGLLREIRDKAKWFFNILIADMILLCIFILFFTSVCWLVFLGYLFPSYSWDALYYHLPIVGQIMQSGAIQEHHTPSFIQQYINIFPKNINLFYLWNVIFLRSSVIVDLSQLFFTLAGVLAVYSLAVKLKIKEKYAIYSSFLFFFTPAIVLQSTVNYIDVAVSMMFLIAINFSVYDNPENRDGVYTISPLRDRRTPILLSGLAAGILLGAKPTGPVFFVVLTGAVLVRELIKHFNRSTITSSGNKYSLSEGLRTNLIYFMIPALLMGCYWYARNWVFYGNPVYFVDISIFNIKIFEGLESNWVEPPPPIMESLSYVTRLLHVWMEKVEYYMYDSRLSGFGPIWFILFLPAILFSIPYAITKRRYGFIFAGMILLVTLLVHPRNWNIRYTIFIVGLGALSFGFILNVFSKREKAIRLIALLLAVYTVLTANSPCIMPGKIKEFLALPAEERTLSRLQPSNIDIRVRSEYGYWIWIDKNISGSDTLAYTFVDDRIDTSSPFFLAPLWNREFSNKVLYVKSDTYKEWLENLTRANATYILIKKDSIEDEWIEKERKVFYAYSWMGNMTEKFKIVYSDDRYKIIRFNRT